MFMLSVTIKSIVLSVVMPGGAMLSVVAPCLSFIPSAALPKNIRPEQYCLKVKTR